MDPELKLDKNNPPKYCPFCAKKGIKSKVKKFKIKAVSDDPTIMCKNGEASILLSLKRNYLSYFSAPGHSTCYLTPLMLRSSLPKELTQER